MTEQLRDREFRKSEATGYTSNGVAKSMWSTQHRPVLLLPFLPLASAGTAVSSPCSRSAGDPHHRLVRAVPTLPAVESEGEG
jgi:hypothetical protein